jgi:hypothetical protein
MKNVFFLLIFGLMLNVSFATSPLDNDVGEDVKVEFSQDTNFDVDADIRVSENNFVLHEAVYDNKVFSCNALSDADKTDEVFILKSVALEINSENWHSPYLYKQEAPNINYKNIRIKNFIQGSVCGMSA